MGDLCEDVHESGTEASGSGDFFLILVLYRGGARGSRISLLLFQLVRQYVIRWQIRLGLRFRSAHDYFERWLD
jgi:hypothetical protein